MSEIKSTNSNTRIQDWSDVLSLSNPNRNPLLNQIVTRGNVVGTGETSINWVDYQVENTKTLVTAALTDVATTLTVEDSSIFTVGQLIVLNDELIKISAIPTATTLTIVRAQQGTTAAAAVVGDVVFLVSDGKAEGSTYATGTYKKGGEFTNRLQIFITPFEISGTARVQNATGANGKSLYQLELEKKQAQHEAKIEKALMQGIGFYDSGADIRTLTGVRNFLKNSNVVAVGGVLTLAKINSLLNKAYEQGAELDKGSYRIVLNPSVIDKLLETNSSYFVTNTVMNDEIGGQVNKIRTNYGIFELLPSNNTKVSEGFLIDLDSIKFRPLVKNGSRALELQEMGLIGDKEQWQFVTEGTFEIRNIHLQGILTGMTLA